MPIQTFTSFDVLMKLAGAVGEAKKTGDTILIERAEAEHEAYKKLCLTADGMSLGSTRSGLESRPRV